MSCAGRRRGASRSRSRWWSSTRSSRATARPSSSAGRTLPWSGQFDITLEALVYGGVLGLRILAIFGTAVFLTAAVDADELLRGAAPRLAALGRHRGARHAPVRRAAPRRARGSPTRSAACPAAAPRGSPCCTRSRPARSTARPTSPPRSRCAASASPAGPPRMPRPWSRHDFAFAASRRRAVRDRRSACSRARGREFDAYPRLWRRSTPRDPDRDRRARRRARSRRSPTAAGSGDEPSLRRSRRSDAIAIPARTCRRCDGVSLTVEPGELVLLAGGSGSGKSTLLRAACGLVPHFHGGTFAGTRA